ncbi:hypothetical protein NVS08_04150, partial [Enterobacter kobei]|uniref:hypothetical protein n=1 Tax=Enterobacter kobei TaxID=208224 RepID=UPI00254B1371
KKLLFFCKTNICIVKEVAASQMLKKQYCFDLHHSTISKTQERTALDSIKGKMNKLWTQALHPLDE